MQVYTLGLYPKALMTSGKWLYLYKTNFYNTDNMVCTQNVDNMIYEQQENICSKCKTGLVLTMQNTISLLLTGHRVAFSEVLQSTTG